MDSSASDWPHLLSLQNDPAQEQMPALVAQHGERHGAFNTGSSRRRPPSGTDRGQPVTMVSAGARNDAWHFQHQNGRFLGSFSQLGTSDKLLADAAATMTNGSPESQEQEYFHDGPRPESVYAGRRSNQESNFEQDTQHGNLVRRSKQMPTVKIQVPVNRVAQQIRFPYSYHYDRNFSYRQYLNSFRSEPLHVRPSSTDPRPHQNPHSNKAMSSARLNDAAPEEFASCYMVENVLGGPGVPTSVTGPPKSDTLAAKQNGGRRQGPLGNHARAHAASTRHDGSCWHCKLQRSQVSVVVLPKMVHELTYPFYSSVMPKSSWACVVNARKRVTRRVSAARGIHCRA